MMSFLRGVLFILWRKEETETLLVTQKGGGEDPRLYKVCSKIKNEHLLELRFQSGDSCLQGIFELHLLLHVSLGLPPQSFNPLQLRLSLVHLPLQSLHPQGELQHALKPKYGGLCSRPWKIYLITTVIPDLFVRCASVSPHPVSCWGLSVSSPVDVVTTTCCSSLFKIQREKKTGIKS